MLQLSAKEDTDRLQKGQKGAVKIGHLVFLVECLWGGTPEEKAILDLVLTAFWSMARLGELTYWKNSGPPKEKGELLVQDVAFRLSRSGDPRALITPREAKTSKLGEEQMLQLLHQNNLLCPVMAVRRRISEARSPTNTLLGFYLQDGTRYNLTKSWVRHVLQGAWKKGNYEGISGHSFRVGGASLRFALDIPVEEIMKLGCWVLDCYKLYIQEYTKAEVKETKALLAQLEACWCNANQTC
ncbi:hypothetical protein PCANC_18026 [Puccinia coronata f. sp. avenae]|uniref:Tyr recombinase domain-containing protein n=2 Tax=Puccinia coronata f. sp. avenae TaxID=200324 RepID=A0A2N5SJ12_9BASI|nr:hypothetical protein PCANC_18026 [Puccinia coronata f. sp. avenae]